MPAPALEPFAVGQPITLLIGYTGVAAPTKESVGDVRRQWLADGAHFNRLFSACGRIAQQARHALAVGDTATLGRLMWDNHTLLQEMTVSSAELDALVVAARTAGALGQTKWRRPWREHDCPRDGRDKRGRAPCPAHSRSAHRSRDGSGS
ncbi:MAG: hypothetical protein IPL28_11695 [Chloroflexi bacterium]|nr:hypothetical protein [Chloroflexota bacterium]